MARATTDRHGPVTIERLESALDRLATAMVAYGPGAEAALPVYARLEAELAEMQRGEARRAEAMEAVRIRARRSMRAPTKR